MNKFKKIFMTACILTVSFALTGCGNTKELANAYKKMSVGKKDNQINGYTLSIRLFGVFGENKVNESIKVSNYMGTSYRIATDTDTYYLINDKKYKVAAQNEDKTDFGRMLDNNISVEKYTKIDENIPFTDTNKYLLSLKNAKADDEPAKEKIGEVEYKTYTYSVRKNDANKLLAETSLEKEKLAANVPAKVWINPEGYVYKIEYDIAAGYKSTSLLSLVVYYNGINNASEISINLEDGE